ncbi:hypothetical protein BLNAU_6002 [Blattamonas nauphoetae]|uniref:Uncharacterized protein n=1 Tax=Blattamonas nauphoetae TaxID=2049346 RepID=A0ABQ9Y5G6_9EUKA|nr:hypothetical protein BLNAU_6002 [Blattamonas nauphoetae]
MHNTIFINMTPPNVFSSSSSYGYLRNPVVSCTSQLRSRYFNHHSLPAAQYQMLNQLHTPPTKSSFQHHRRNYIWLLWNWAVRSIIYSHSSRDYHGSPSDSHHPATLPSESQN